MTRFFAAVAVLWLAVAATPSAAAADLAGVPIHGYEIVQTLPHDPDAFTQGLVYADGVFYEGTGGYGASRLRIVEPATGRVLRERRLPAVYFGEGIALLAGKIYQLTWRAGRGFVYAADTLEPLGEFRYEDEGWGLTTDGRLLIMSDGTARLRFLDPVTFEVRRAIEVRTPDGNPVAQLNELEYVNGEIYANVWQRDVVARIDPATGRLLGWIDLAGLLPAGERGDVLNGIAYDAAGGRLFVTGKLWPRLFEIRLK